MRNLDQERAAHAAVCIKRIKERNEKDDYAREAKKMPVRIMNAGLGQALVFLAAKAHRKDRINKILERLELDLKDWVIGKCAICSYSLDASLLENIIHQNATSDDLRRATNEVLAYLQWLNRFAEAYGLKGDDHE